ncbi:hypothetical protein L7F22_007989 [Adiantum nelumboides]|nr:hypothetical protein [Adiantum nelumboides]
MARIIIPGAHDYLQGIQSVEYLHRACKDGLLHKAVDTLETLHCQKVSVSKKLLISLIERCAKEGNLALARCLESVVLRTELDPPTLLADAIIHLFSACGSLADANRVFLNIFKPCSSTWSAIIQANARLGANLMAIKLYCELHVRNQKPDKNLIKAIIKACSSTEGIDFGRLVYHQVICMKIFSIANALILMYVKGGSLDDALSIFYRTNNQDICTWSILIVGCSRCGYNVLAFELFREMQDRGIQIDRVAILCMLKACNLVCQGMYVHNVVVKHNLEYDKVISSAMVGMYAKCGSLTEACNVFNRVQIKDAVLWTCIIAGCIDLKQDILAIELFQRMLLEGTMANEFSFSSIFKACGNAQDLEQGRIIHDMKIRTDLASSVIEGNSLIRMYAQCGALEDALGIFDRVTIKSVVSWGTIIHACADNGCSGTALSFFDKFQEINLVPDDVIFLGVIKACGNTGTLLQGMKMHNSIIIHGYTNIYLGNTLVDMYSKCQRMDEALDVFDSLPSRSCVSWSAMLAGYNQQEEWTIALDLFDKVLSTGLELDEVIFLEALEACGNVGSMGQGMLIHDQIVRHNFHSDRVVGSALLDTYGKSGYLHEAFWVFERSPCKSMVTWGTMISKLVHSRNWSLARTCLSQMQQQGMRPSPEIYSCVLTACSSAGLAEEGQWFFHCLKEDHGDFEKIEHLSCMVDLFGRIGLLKESEDFVQTMPIPPNEISWTSFVTSCKTYCRLQVRNYS